MSDIQQVTNNQLSADMDTFLQLLTTQMQNQDPLKPTDPTDFVAQLAQFSSVEQAVQTNDRLGEIFGQLQADSLKIDSALIDKAAEVETRQIALQNGSAAIHYSLPRDTQTAELTIRDQNGEIVAEFDGPTAAGDHQIQWNGAGIGGITVPSGLYSVEVLAKDGAGDPVPAATHAHGIITEIEQGDGESRFTLDSGITVTESAIKRVSRLPDAAANAGGGA